VCHITWQQLIMGKPISKTFFSVYKILFFFIPIPVFFDFGSFEFFLIAASDYSPFKRPAIPFPVGGFALFLALVIGYFLSLSKSKKIISVFRPLEILVFLFFFVTGMGLYAIYFSGLSVPRFIQLILPVLLVSSLSFPASYQSRVSILKFYISGLFFVIFLHSLSLIITSSDPLSIDDRLEYSSVFGLHIYQALVSYPGVISLALFLFLGVLHRQFSKIPLIKSKIFTFMCLAAVFSAIYLGLASGRKAFVAEFLAGLVIVFGFCFFYALAFQKIFYYSMLSFLLFLTLSLSILFFYMNTNLSQRVRWSLETSNLDSGRISKLSEAFEFFSENLDVLFFGAGGGGAPGMHNFILDQIYRVGIVGAFISYFSFAYLIRRFYKNNNKYLSFGLSRVMFLILVLSCLFWQSMVNASMSQPYYLVNVVVVFSMIIFSVFSVNKLKKIP